MKADLSNICSQAESHQCDPCVSFERGDTTIYALEGQDPGRSLIEIMWDMKGIHLRNDPDK